MGSDEKIVLKLKKTPRPFENLRQKIEGENSIFATSLNSQKNILPQFLQTAPLADSKSKKRTFSDGAIQYYPCPKLHSCEERLKKFISSKDSNTNG